MSVGWLQGETKVRRGEEPLFPSILTFCKKFKQKLSLSTMLFLLSWLLCMKCIIKLNSFLFFSDKDKNWQLDQTKKKQTAQPRHTSVLISLFSRLCLLHVFWRLACASFAVTGQWPGIFQACESRPNSGKSRLPWMPVPVSLCNSSLVTGRLQLNPESWHVYWTFWRCSSDVHEQWSNQNLQQYSSFVSCLLWHWNHHLFQLGWVVTPDIIHTTATVSPVLKTTHCHIPRQNQQNNVLSVTAHPIRVFDLKNFIRLFFDLFSRFSCVCQWSKSKFQQNIFCGWENFSRKQELKPIFDK